MTAPQAAQLAVLAAAIAGLGGLLALLAYGLLLEPARFTVTRREVSLPDWPAALDGLTIWHLSDLHSRGRGRVERFLLQLAGEAPTADLVVLTGDVAEWRRALPDALVALAPWRGRLGSFAVLGNNDERPPSHQRAVAAGLARVGFTVLANQAVQVTRNGHRLTIAGVTFLHEKQVDAGASYPVTELLAGTAGPTLLLSHSPDAAVEAAAAGVDLMMAGHTHGGQICLPGGRPVQNNLHRFPAPAMSAGLCRHGGTVVHVSRGLGMSAPALRTWCPPEVTLLTLRSTAPAAG